MYQIIGRALLWKTDSGLYLDRIYGSEPVQMFMETYAKNKGWMTYNVYADEAMFVNINSDIEYDSLPYLDTFIDNVHYTRDGNTYLGSK